MKLKDPVTISGWLTITISDETGIKKIIEVPNLVVTAGKEYIASRIIGTSTNVISHMAVGTGINVPISLDTTLTNELGRVALGSLTKSSTSIIATANFPAGVGTGNISEAGIFNNSAGGVMLCRTVFPAYEKLAGEALAISWKLQIS